MDATTKLKEWFENEKLVGLVDVKVSVLDVDKSISVESLSQQILDMINAPVCVDQDFF